MQARLVRLLYSLLPNNYRGTAMAEEHPPDWHKIVECNYFGATHRPSPHRTLTLVPFNGGSDLATLK